MSAPSRVGVRLVALVLCAACTGETGCVGSAEPDTSVADGRLRVLFLEELRAEAGWAGDWLHTDGWAFFGFRLEPGASGRVGLRWSDPRYRAEAIADVECGVAAHRPAKFLIGVRVRPGLIGPIPWSCESCGSSFNISGTILSNETECPRCREPHDLAPEWTSSPLREFRLLVVGAVAEVTGGRGLKRSGEDFRTSAERTVLFTGTLRRESALVPADSFDIEAMRRPASADGLDPNEYRRPRPPDLAAGTQRLALLLDPHGMAHGGDCVTSSGRHASFEVTSDRVTIRGDEGSHEILVDGQVVSLEHYPFAVWDLSLTWKPQSMSD